MKKLVLAMALFVGVSTVLPPMATAVPRHRTHVVQEAKGQKESAGSSKKHVQKDEQDEDDEGIEAYSDTTAVDTVGCYDDNDAADSAQSNSTSIYSLSRYSDPFDFLGNVFGKGGLIFFVLLAILFVLLIVFAPFIVVILVLRYLVRRHNDRVKLAEMAMEKGQTIPENVRPIDKQTSGYLVKRGLRNVFLGAGLCVMFLIWEADFLAGIGALVFFCGLGQAVIGALPKLKQMYQEWQDRRNGYIKP